MAAPKAHVCILIAAFLLCATTVRAHHSFGAEYDATRPVTVTGVVTKIEWTNPHCHFYVDVTDEQGKVVNWKFEGYGIGPLYRNGWKRDVTMKAGEITLPNGQKMFFGPPVGTGEGGNTPAVEVK
jgi:hypothetical protein